MRKNSDWQAGGRGNLNLVNKFYIVYELWIIFHKNESEVS